MSGPELIICAIFGVVCLAALALLISFICFMRVFFVPKKRPLAKDEYEMPPGDEYIPFHPQIRDWIANARSSKRELLEINSFDGLRLRGYYYEYSPSSPIELLFHGYGGNAERDLSAAVERCAALGRSCCLIDQRASGMSEGWITTFGIKEKRDCLSWVSYAVDRFPGRTLIIGGISMGAATVLMAAGEELPREVASVMADCPYSSPREIIKKVVKDMHLPASVVYPFIKLGAAVYGGFNIEEDSPIEAVRRARKPIIFIHGDSDGFVPHQMSVDLYYACASRKQLVTVHGADHGLAYPVNKEQYLRALKDFEEAFDFLDT